MRPIRISFLNASGDIGGAERALLLLIENLDRTRFTPSVVCFGRGRFVDALQELGLPATVIPLGAAEKLSRTEMGGLGAKCAGFADLAGALARLTAHLRVAAPDVIHTNNIKTHLIGGVAGRILRRPVIWHMRDLVAEGRQRVLFQRAAKLLPQRILAVSQTVQEQFHGAGADDRVHTVHDAVDPARYLPARSAAEVRASLNVPPDAVVLAMVAHYAQWKGHLVFLETLARLVDDGLPVMGMVVGGSIYANLAERDYEASVHARATELGLDGRVIFTGFQNCVPDFLNAADILVHSPIRPEPFGLAIIEAMLLGKPVIAAAAGGMLETVEAGTTGLLVPPGEVAGFVEAARSLVTDPLRREAMGAAGRARVHQFFTPGVHYARIETIYRELLEL